MSNGVAQMCPCCLEYILNLCLLRPSDVARESRRQALALADGRHALLRPPPFDLHKSHVSSASSYRSCTEKSSLDPFSPNLYLYSTSTINMSLQAIKQVSSPCGSVNPCGGFFLELPFMRRPFTSKLLQDIITDAIACRKWSPFAWTRRAPKPSSKRHKPRTNS